MTGLKSTEIAYRPTTERTRMAIFNMINHSNFIEENILDGAVVADICCGSGSYGLEALSRGAKKVYFIDKDPKQIHLVRKNVSHFKEEVNSVFLNINATNLSVLVDKIDIVFIDPPYEKGLADVILLSLSNCPSLSDQHVIIIEVEKLAKLKYPENFTVLNEREYSKTKVIFGRFSNESKVSAV